MAQKRGKKKKDQNKALNSEGRVRKIVGISLLVFSLYLLISFTSYFFTWKEDQDQVLQFAFSMLFNEDIVVNNWLGRLGAVTSSFFFYWSFGVGSFLFIPLLAKLGVYIIRKGRLSAMLPFILRWLLFIAFISILNEFLFSSSVFPWGGAFGNNICYWLQSFIGSIGLFILLLFALVSWLVWKFNPSFDALAYVSSGRSFAIPSISVYKNKFQFKSGVGEEEKKGSALKPKNKDRGQYELEVIENRPINEKADIPKGTLDLDLDPQYESHLKESSLKPSSPQPMNSPVTKQDLEIHDSISDNEPKLETVRTSNLADVPLAIQQDNADHDEFFDPTKELSFYKHPVLDVLEEYSELKFEIDREELEDNKDQIIKTLLNYKIEIIKIRATIGPTVTLYEIVPAPGVKISKIKNLEDDIALSLAALGIRIIAPIPGKGTIGIEVPNKKPQVVSLKEVLRSDKYQNAKMDLPIALGKTISNEVFVADLAKMPHLLIAGATGQGKSVGINTILMSLLYKKHPSQVKLVLIDPKKVELFPYSFIENHFLAYLPDEDEPIVTETKKVIHTLNSLCMEMDERYDLLKKARSRNIKEYNEKFTNRKLNPLNGHKFLPFIVLVIDEFADLIMTAGKEVELPIARLAQLARAVGIHLIIATQRPSVNIITGVIKANFPARIAFKVTSKIDSRTILDQGGADQLIGRGDMLLSVGGNLVRLQCAFVDTPEVEKVISHISSQQGFPTPFLLPEYVSDEDAKVGDSDMKMSDLDELFRDAAQLVVANQLGSTSMIQRKMQLGYNRAGRIMDQMEAMRIVGPAQGSKPREVYVMSEMELMGILDRIYNK
ncbi:MAG: DNA translocase FtsK [Saprospiraceae bacterium]